MAIVKEVTESGLTITSSDSGKKIKKTGTNEVYIDASDLSGAIAYEETTEDIDPTSTTRLSAIMESIHSFDYKVPAKYIGLSIDQCAAIYGTGQGNWMSWESNIAGWQTQNLEVASFIWAIEAATTKNRTRANFDKANDRFAKNAATSKRLTVAWWRIIAANKAQNEIDAALVILTSDAGFVAWRAVPTIP